MRLLTRNLTHINFPVILDTMGLTLSVGPKQSIADEFNNVFVGVGPNLAKKITVADNADSMYKGQQCPNSMFINPVNENEVGNIIKSCK